MRYYSSSSDFYYDTTASTLNYYIAVNGETIYNGKAVKSPSKDAISINVGKRVRDYIRISMPDFSDYDGVVVPHPEAMLVFNLFNLDSGELLEQYNVRLDDTKEWSGEEGCLSEPINTHADPRQKIFYGGSYSSAYPVDITSADTGYDPVVPGVPGTDEIWVNKSAYSTDGLWLTYRGGEPSQMYIFDIYKQGHSINSYQVIERDTYKVLKFPFSLSWAAPSLRFKDTVKQLQWVKLPPSYWGQDAEFAGPTNQIPPNTSKGYAYENTELTAFYYTYSKEWYDWYCETYPQTATVPGWFVCVIPFGGFVNCTALKKIEIGDGKYKFGTQSFLMCYGLERLYIPEAEQVYLYARAFQDCLSLSYVSLPNNFSMGTNIPSIPVFKGCTSLTDIIFRGTMEQLNSIMKPNTQLAEPGVVIHCTDGDVIEE